MRKIEVCCSSLAEAREAEAGGAVRIELCAAIACGGVTPSRALIDMTAEADLGLDVNVIIRPREGNFLYTAEEAEIMRRDIAYCREAGVHGVVIGALTPEGDIDMEMCRRMIDAAGEMSVTFHRAFDVCRTPRCALEQIIDLGCDRLLTSGQQPAAEQGAELIAELVRQADGRIIVMPGAGIRPSNIADVERITRAEEFHSTARSSAPDGMSYRNPDVSFAVEADETIVRRTDRRVVSQLVNDAV